MAQWYLRKSDGTEYGPAGMDALREWAEDGRIAPEDQLSEDRTNWRQAPSVEGLEMEYEIVLDGGDTYGPLHVLALRELIDDGSITLATAIRHIDTQEVKSAAERLLSVYVRRNTQLLARIDEMSEQHTALALHTTELAAEKTDLEQKVGELTETVESLEQRLLDAPTPPPKTKEKQETSTFISGDSSLKDVQKWKVLYESERTQRLESEEKSAAENRDLRHQLHETQSARDRLNYRVNQLEKNLEEMQSALEGSGMDYSASPTAVMESYQHLSDNYDSLLEQLNEKSEDLNSLREARDQVEQEAGTRIRSIEERLYREREEADKARKRLAELENAHMEIVRSFRDLNDRYIRLRQQSPSGPPPPPRQASSPPKTTSAKPENDPSASPASAKDSDAESTRKTKLRLT